MTNSVVASAVDVGITGAFAVCLYIDTVAWVHVVVCLTIALQTKAVRHYTPLDVSYRRPQYYLLPP